MATVNTEVNNAVYAIVNEIAQQALGSKAVTAIDTRTFVNLGDAVLSSNDATETFMSTLLLRVARTYYTVRPYTSSLKDLVVSGEEWAAIYQKIDVSVGDFVSDETFELVDGQSVDQYIVRKPTATQKLFVRRSTYSNFITISRKTLQGAFTSEAMFAQFLRAIDMKMRTKLDFATENMARLAIGNYIANADPDTQVVPLVTNYNTEKGLTGDDALDETTALLDKDFLAYAAGEIELVCKRMRNLSTIYNAEGEERHTPESEQKLLVYDKFQSRLQHVLQYQAFHDELVSLRNFIEVPYWQGEQARTTIKVTVDDGEGASEAVTIENVIAFAFDRYALGTFRSDEETLTTPVNARARYYNVFHFAEQLWYNDLSEQGVYFTLN